ncbi:hypothetical protein T07_4582, partial [Trichinella nelsoni]
LKICQPLKPANQTIRVNKRNSCHAFQRARPHRQPMIKPNSSSTPIDALCLGTDQGDADGRHGSILLNLNNQRAKQQIQTGGPTRPNSWRRYAREQPENENAFKSIAAKFVPAPQTTETTAYHSANQIQLVTVTSSVAISNSIGDHLTTLQKGVQIKNNKVLHKWYCRMYH